MKKKTSQKIIDLFKEKTQLSPSELTDLLEISGRGVRKQLKKLYDEGILEKKGRPPKVFYSLRTVKNVVSGKVNIKKACRDIIDKNFVVITSVGDWKEGAQAFSFFCEKRGLDLGKSAEAYCEIFKKYDDMKRNGLLDGISKMKNTFDDVYLDELYYLDFYSIERFGKTKLGQMLLYAKQSQNKKLIKKLVNLIKPRVDALVKCSKVDAVGFIPPTVKREVQIMKEIKKHLKLSIPVLPIVKVKGDIAVPQKTLSKLEDRVENARGTIVAEHAPVYSRILLIDDAVGSGSTLNETAAQLKKKGIANKVIGLAITGSFKGFDVISEV